MRARRIAGSVLIALPFVAVIMAMGDHYGFVRLLRMVAFPFMAVISIYLGCRLIKFDRNIE